MVVSYITIRPNNFTLKYLPKKNEKICSHIDLYINAYIGRVSLIRNSWDQKYFRFFLSWNIFIDFTS